MRIEIYDLSYRGRVYSKQMLTWPLFWGMAKDAEIPWKLDLKRATSMLAPGRRREY